MSRRDRDRDNDISEHLDDLDQSMFDSKDGDRGDGKGSKRSFHRKKCCRFCADTEVLVDYKDVKLMQSFLGDPGKIVPRRISGTCATHQRKLTVAVKRARNLALVGFVTIGGQDNFRF